jgi:hypothetical protein
MYSNIKISNPTANSSALSYDVMIIASSGQLCQKSKMLNEDKYPMSLQLIRKPLCVLVNPNCFSSVVICDATYTLNVDVINAVIE